MVWSALFLGVGNGGSSDIALVLTLIKQIGNIAAAQSLLFAHTVKIIHKSYHIALKALIHLGYQLLLAHCYLLTLQAAGLQAVELQQLHHVDQHVFVRVAHREGGWL